MPIKKNINSSYPPTISNISEHYYEDYGLIISSFENLLNKPLLGIFLQNVFSEVW